VHERADLMALQASSERGCSFHHVSVNEVPLCTREDGCFKHFLEDSAKMLQRVCYPLEGKGEVSNEGREKCTKSSALCG